MERLGMLVDVSHLGDGLLALGVGRHEGLRRQPLLLPGPPGSPAQPDRRADPRGGRQRRLRGHQRLGRSCPTQPRPDRTAHVGHAVSLVGPERVALGLDFMRDLVDAVDPVLGGALVDPDALPWVEASSGPRICRPRGEARGGAGTRRPPGACRHGHRHPGAAPRRAAPEVSRGQEHVEHLRRAGIEPRRCGANEVGEVGDRAAWSASMIAPVPTTSLAYSVTSRISLTLIWSRALYATGT